MRRREFLVSGSAASAAAFPAWAAQQRPAGLRRVNIVSTAGTTQTVIAALIDRMGWFQALGIEANYLTVADGNKVVAALISGSADLCPTSGFTQVLAGIEKGAPLKILGGGAIKNFTALMSANPQVRTLKDLEGRTVGIGALGAQLHQTMLALFRKYGVDSRKVRFVNVGSSVDVLRAVMARVIDAGASEVWLQPNGVHIVENGKLFESLPEFVNQAAFTADRAIAQRRDLVVRALAAYARAYRFIMSGDSEQAFIAASRTALGPKSDEAAARAQWRFWRQIQPFAADLALPPERIRFMQDLNVLTGVQKRVLPYATVMDTTLARDVNRLIRA